MFKTGDSQFKQLTQNDRNTQLAKGEATIIKASLKHKSFGSTTIRQATDLEYHYVEPALLNETR